MQELINITLLSEGRLHTTTVKKILRTQIISIFKYTDKEKKKKEKNMTKKKNAMKMKEII